MQRKQLLIGLTVAILAIVIAVGSFTFLLPQVIGNVEAPAALKDESLAFVRDVVGMNLTEYQVVKFSFWPQDDIASPNGPLYLVRYSLKSASDETSVDIYYVKSNGTYIHAYFDMRSNEMFSPAYPGDKVLNWSRGFLERYTIFKNNSTYLQNICATLDTVTHLEPMNTTCSGVTLQITIKEFSETEIYTTLQFRPLNQTAHDYDNAVTLEFHNGVWFNFIDNIQQ